MGGGQCVARPAAGTLQVTIGATTFVAEQLATVANGASVQISARAAGQTILLDLPAKLGESTCAAGGYLAWLLYFPDGAPGYFNRLGAGARPDCVVNLGKVGDVGERIEGTFSATLIEYGTGSRTVQLTNGTFSVERVAYP